MVLRSIILFDLGYSMVRRLLEYRKYSMSSIQVIFVKRIGAKILWLSYAELVAGGNEWKEALTTLQPCNFYKSEDSSALQPTAIFMLAAI